jgi:hypothetical protein
MYFMAKIAERLLYPRDGETASKPVGLFIAKFLILVFSVLMGVHFMEKRVIIPLLNYVLHIFIISLSLRTIRTRDS